MTAPSGAVASPKGWWPLRLPSLLVVVLWIIVVALGVTAMMRVFAWDALQPFAVADALTIAIYLPAWGVVVVAGLGRRPGLGAAALCICLAQVVFLAPEFLASQPVPPWAVTAKSIKLFDANVYYHNPSMAGFAAAIASSNPQLVTLEEATPQNQARLQAAGAFTALPFRLTVDELNPFSFEVASAFPLSKPHIISAFGQPYLVQTRITTPSGAVELWVVHTEAPVSGDFEHWRFELATLADQVRSFRGAPLLITGDFNATWGNQGFRNLLRTGLVDAAAARGDALDMTWSQTMGVIPPLARIDHILTGPRLAARSIESVPGPGSDHRSLEATIALHPAPR